MESAELPTFILVLDALALQLRCGRRLDIGTSVRRCSHEEVEYLPHLRFAFLAAFLEAFLSFRLCQIDVLPMWE